MPHQASDGRQPAQGIDNAYIATQADLQSHVDAQAVVDAMRPGLPQFDLSNPNRYVFVAAFDGTGNDATQTEDSVTNVHRLYEDFDRFIHGDGPDRPGFSRMHARYIEGPGTQSGSLESTQDGMDGRTVQDRVFEMYKDLGDKVRQWKSENPDAEVGVVTFGFSRGAVEAAEFASVIGKYGIHADVQYANQQDDDVRNYKQTWGEYMRGQPGSVPVDAEFRNLSDPLIAPGKVPIVAGLFDPVATGVAADRQDRELPKDITAALQLTARDEHRVFFPVNDIVNADVVGRREEDPARPERIANLTVAGCHSDVGGGYADGQGLALSSKNIMGAYLNNMIGREICREVAVDVRECVVHDSNVGAMQKAGRAQTGYWFADRTETGVTLTPDGRYQVMSGIDPNLHGAKRVEMPSVNTALTETTDDGLRARPERVEARLDKRAHDDHTPQPPNTKLPLEAPREADPVKLLLESSTRISNLMDRDANPGSAAILHEFAHADETRHSILSVGDSPQGRLSAAVALAAREEGMDRIGEIFFNEDRTQLIIADRRDNHDDLAKFGIVDIAEALGSPMREHLQSLDPALVGHGARGPTLYDQAHGLVVQQQVMGHLSFATDAERIDAAADIARQARADGLTAIQGLAIVRPDEGGPTRIAALQDGDAPRQSQPVAVPQPDDAPLQQAHAPRAQSLS